eukprot:GILK01005818.1.p1 GENE.GILK01005818.1~~GILK01005818.1.p1  ORF type:complete len:751 (+),score=153.68 GILK01005818.1:48-2255(+)
MEAERRTSASHLPHWTALSEESLTWNLSSDNKLFDQLEAFSARIIQRTKELEKDVNDLIFQAGSTSVRLHNTFNEFLMLSSSQFIENRVYDDDEIEKQDKAAAAEVPSKPEQKELSKEEKEAQLRDKLKSALNLGLSALEIIPQLPEDLAPLRSSTPVPVSPTSSTAHAAQAVNEKDPYNSRPLPYIIGTPEWYTHDNLGLVFLGDDQEVDDDAASVCSIDEEIASMTKVRFADQLPVPTPSLDQNGHSARPPNAPEEGRPDSRANLLASIRARSTEFDQPAGTTVRQTEPTPVQARPVQEQPDSQRASVRVPAGPPRPSMADLFGSSGDESSAVDENDEEEGGALFRSSTKSVGRKASLFNLFGAPPEPTKAVAATSAPAAPDNRSSRKHNKKPSLFDISEDLDTLDTTPTAEESHEPVSLFATTKAPVQAAPTNNTSHTTRKTMLFGDTDDEEQEPPSFGSKSNNTQNRATSLFGQSDDSSVTSSNGNSRSSTVPQPSERSVSPIAVPVAVPAVGNAFSTPSLPTAPYTPKPVSMDSVTPPVVATVSSILQDVATALGRVTVTTTVVDPTPAPPASAASTNQNNEAAPSTKSKHVSPVNQEPIRDPWVQMDDDTLDPVQDEPTNPFLEDPSFVHGLLVSQVYQLTLPLQSVVFKKVSFSNDSDHRRSYLVHSDMPALMRIRSSKISIKKKSRKYIHFSFEPICTPIRTKIHVVIRRCDDLVVEECLLFRVSYG